MLNKREKTTTEREGGGKRKNENMAKYRKKQSYTSIIEKSDAVGEGEQAGRSNFLPALPCSCQNRIQLQADGALLYHLPCRLFVLLVLFQAYVVFVFSYALVCVLQVVVLVCAICLLHFFPQLYSLWACGCSTLTFPPPITTSLPLYGLSALFAALPSLPLSVMVSFPFFCLVYIVFCPRLFVIRYRLEATSSTRYRITNQQGTDVYLVCWPRLQKEHCPSHRFLVPPFFTLSSCSCSCFVHIQSLTHECLKQKYRLYIYMKNYISIQSTQKYEDQRVSAANGTHQARRCSATVVLISI